jgi:hypothetical protein
VGISVGPLKQNRGIDARWTVFGTNASVGLLHPHALSPDTVIRSHDPGMYQPTLFRQNPYPDYFTSVVVEASAYPTVEFYLHGTN